jgi:ubiquinone/menaquinone biosynthesis C-methylase UbiE
MDARHPPSPVDHIVGFRDEIARASADTDEFFGWFNNQSSFEEAYFSGGWDFAWHVATPVSRHLHKAVTAEGGLCALEIGCGGGRLLAHAARMFPRVIGVDIHDQLDLVGLKLRELGITNVDLRQGDGRCLPCADGQVDVVYSCIVLQHVETLTRLRGYLQETFRVLKPGGLAMLYVGRLRTWSTHRDSKLRLACDLILERVRMPRGYEELDAPVNSTNLRVTRPFMRSLVRDAGFVPLMTNVSRRRVPHETGHFGGQHGFLVRKPW